MTAGSPLWQTIFVSFALILIAFEIARGWRLGLVRQLVRVLAVLAAYAAGLFGGRLLLPILRDLIRAPDLLLSVVSGAILAVLIYALITGVGAVLFKRTGQQKVGAVRLLYGLSGAFLGIFFGFLSVWLIVVGIRSVGAIASAEVKSGTRPPPFAPVQARPVHAAKPAGPPPLVASLAKLKNSIELGSLGEVVKGADVIPATTYQALGKLGAVVSDPRNAERFLSYPGAERLTQNPRILALRDDPEIIDLVSQQRFLELLQNPKLIEAMNDPELAKEVRGFDFQKALDYALRRHAGEEAPPTETGLP
jgi:hypothetical protein